MKKITSLILAMAMVFSLSAQVFALNDDMQDNENSEANMIVITTSKEERDKQFNDRPTSQMSSQWDIHLKNQSEPCVVNLSFHTSFH